MSTGRIRDQRQVLRWRDAKAPTGRTLDQLD
jgi:hypothetical protein